MIPTIAPPIEGPTRPFWSVMIPTYNSSELLDLALKSVLEQDPGPELMEIVVVDDRSTTKASEDSVQRLAPGRVKFVVNETNLRLAGNWNRCLTLSRGRWIHLLHQDDIVLPGFYERLGQAVHDHPDLGMAFCRHGYIDGESQITSVGDPPAETAGVPEGWAETIAVSQRLECPAVVVRREVYEDLGGFDPSLVYSLDWEMWARIASKYRAWYEPEILAYYRRHDSNESARLAGESQQLPDILRGIEMIMDRVPADRRPILRREAARRLRWRRMQEANQLMAGGRTLESLSEVDAAHRLERLPTRLRVLWKYGLWALKDRIRRLVKREVGRGRDAAKDPGTTHPADPGQIPSAIRDQS